MSLDNYYKLARRAKENNDLDAMERYYDLILQEDPDSWEAQFYVLYAPAVKANAEQHYAAIYRFKNNLESVFDSLVALPKKEKGKALEEVAQKSIILLSVIGKGAVSFYNKIGASIRENYKSNCDDSVRICIDALKLLERLVKEKFDNDTYTVQIWMAIFEIAHDYAAVDELGAIYFKEATNVLCGISPAIKETVYQAAIEAMEEANSYDEWQKIIDDFNMVGLDYKDAKKYVKKCQEEIKEYIKFENKDTHTYVEVTPRYLKHGQEVILYPTIDKICKWDNAVFVYYAFEQRGWFYGDRDRAKSNEMFQKIVANCRRSRPNVRVQESSGNMPSKAGCYVATCVYGSYDCPEVWTLRRYRDDTLGSTWYGRAFIRTYYAISPTIVKWFGKTKWFKKMWKGTLDKMVKKLQDKGVEDTPYEDKDWN